MKYRSLPLVEKTHAKNLSYPLKHPLPINKKCWLTTLGSPKNHRTGEP